MQEALQPVTQVATKAGETIISGGGILGALLVLSLLGNVALVYLVVRVQNLRISDNAKIADVAAQMVATFTKVDGMLGNLNDSSKNQASTLQMLTNTMNTIVMSALGRVGVYPGPASLPPGGKT